MHSNKITVILILIPGNSLITLYPVSDGENLYMMEKSSNIGFSKIHGDLNGVKMDISKCSEASIYLP